MNSQILMATGFATATLAMLTARRYGHALFYLLALVETYGQWRYPFHAQMRDYVLGYGHLESVKTRFQATLLAGGAAAMVVGLALLLPILIRRTMGQRLMTLGTLGVVAMLGVELVSLHQVDAMIYHPVGSFALCPIFYAASAGVATAGALLELRRRQRTGPAAA